MSDRRISVRESTRTRLQKRKQDHDGRVTYSDQIRKLLPEDGERLSHSEPLVTISLDDEAYGLVESLAGDGVPLREVIEFWLYLDELDASTSPEQILLEVYRNENNIGHNKNTDNN